MSNTPRTDEEAKDGWSGDACAVGYEFAQSLEREINAQHEEIERLRAQLDKYTRCSESGESLGDTIDMAEEIDRLKQESKEWKAFYFEALYKIRCKADDAYERAAQVCDTEHIAPGLHFAACIRALKSGEPK